MCIIPQSLLYIHYLYRLSKNLPNTYLILISPKIWKIVSLQSPFTQKCIGTFSIYNLIMLKYTYYTWSALSTIKKIFMEFTAFSIHALMKERVAIKWLVVKVSFICYQVNYISATNSSTIHYQDNFWSYIAVQSTPAEFQPYST